MQTEADDERRTRLSRFDLHMLSERDGFMLDGADERAEETSLDSTGYTSKADSCRHGIDEDRDKLSEQERFMQTWY